MGASPWASRFQACDEVQALARPCERDEEDRARGLGLPPAGLVKAVVDRVMTGAIWSDSPGGADQAENTHIRGLSLDAWL
jgi:hypothetical protein